MEREVEFREGLWLLLIYLFCKIGEVLQDGREKKNEGKNINNWWICVKSKGLKGKVTPSKDK